MSDLLEFIFQIAFEVAFELSSLKAAVKFLTFVAVVTLISLGIYWLVTQL